MAAVEWVAAHGAELEGLPAADAAARVTSADLRPRTIQAGVAMTLEYRPDRVSLLLDASGAVVAVRAG